MRPRSDRPMAILMLRGTLQRFGGGKPMSVMAMRTAKVLKGQGFLWLLILLVTCQMSRLAYAEGGGKQRSALEVENYHRLAILPWNLKDRAPYYLDLVFSGIRHSIDETKIFQEYYSYYKKTKEKEQYTKIVDTYKKTLWKKKGFFSKKRPQADVALKIGKQIQADAVLVYEIALRESGTDTLVAYLFAVHTGKQYSAAGTTETFTEEGFNKVSDITAKVMLQYKNDHPSDMIVVQRQQPPNTDDTQATALAQQQQEAARLAAQKRLEEQRQREQAARVAALQRQQEERRRQQQEDARRLAAQQQDARDTTPPTITLSSHNVTQPNKVLPTTSRVWVIGTVQDATGVAEVIVNGRVAPLDREGNFSEEVLLRVGDNPVKVTAIDIHANIADVQFAIEREAAVVPDRRTPQQPTTPTRDMTPPAIVLRSHDISQPVKVPTTRSRVIVQGQVSDPNGVVEVTVNDVMAVLDQHGNFSQPVFLQIGKNPVTVKAMDIYANTADVHFVIEREAGIIQSAELIRQKYNIGKYYAMVIGNNDYRHLPKLETAVNDAKQVGKVLREQYSFETAVLLNATRGDILSTLSRFRRKMNPEDNFLIYYAGHGVFEKVAEEAYWLPVDAQEDDFANWIISDSITSEIKRNPANHILIVADSCYSGTLTRAADVKLETKQKREYFLQKMLGKPSRTLMASGGNEPVADGGEDGHSIFAYTFLRALTHMDQVAFTAEELFYRFVKQSVAGNAEQTPEYSIIRNSGHDGGDFVFVKK